MLPAGNSSNAKPLGKTSPARLYVTSCTVVSLVGRVDQRFPNHLDYGPAVDPNIALQAPSGRSVWVQGKRRCNRTHAVEVGRLHPPILTNVGVFVDVVAVDRDVSVAKKRCEKILVGCAGGFR